MLLGKTKSSSSWQDIEHYKIDGLFGNENILLSTKYATVTSSLLVHVVLYIYTHTLAHTLKTSLINGGKLQHKLILFYDFSCSEHIQDNTISLSADW